MGQMAKIYSFSGNYVGQNSFPAVAQGSDDEMVAFVNDTGQTIKIKAVSVVCDTAVTGDATDKFTLSCQNKGTAGTGTTEVCSLEFAAGVDIVAFDKKALTLSSTAANLLVTDGSVISIKKVEANSGLALPAGVVVIEYQIASV